MGILIAIEGMDACGKATQTKLLEERMPNCVRFSFPEYETEVGKLIGQHLQSQWRACPAPGLNEDGSEYVNALVLQSLMTVNRLEMAPLILQALRSGRNVVLDRYWASGVAYGSADGLDEQWLELIHMTLPRPNLNILIDIPSEDSVVRRPERRDRYETQAGLMGQVRRNYHSLFRRHAERGAEWHIVDGIGTVEEVYSRIEGHAKRVSQAVIAEMDKKQSRIITLN